MRVLAASVVLVGLSAPAIAQERGSVVVDAMTTPGRHFGIGYYVTDRLSIRPSLGIGHSQQLGTTFNFGADTRFELLPDRRFSPYLTAGFNYVRDPYLVPYDPTGASLGRLTNVARYGGGAGFRTRIKYGLSLVGEGRVMNSELRDGSGAFYQGQQSVRSGAHFQAAVGLSYTLN
ncbi:MAG TPA: hypothetical protein VI669_01950 [Vicinamibacteria bacterium]